MERQSAQEMPQGHCRPLDEETRGKALWLQEPRQRVPQDQADTPLQRDGGQPPRLQGDGQPASGSAGERQRGGRVDGRGICGDGERGRGQEPDTCDMREGDEGSSIDRGTKGEQPQKVKDTLPCGTRLRVYGADDVRVGLPRGRHSEGKSQYRIDKSGLQHVQIGANQ